MGQLNEAHLPLAPTQESEKVPQEKKTLDIPNLKQIQLDLVNSELKYRRLFESAKDGILILNAITGIIVDINPFLLHLLGYSAKECIGMSLWDIGFFRNVKVSKKLFKELQDTGYVRYDDLPLETKDGRAVQVEFVSNVYAAGENSVIQCNIRDITERKRDDDNLHRMASIIENADDCITLMSLDGIIQSWNPGAKHIFGYEANEIIGKQAKILCPPDLCSNQAEIIESVRSGINIQHYETIRVGKNGKPIEVSISLSQIRDIQGDLTGYSSIIRDITKSKQVEAKLSQSQKMEGIGRLAGGIAHDFNNLLTAILGYSELLMRSLSPSDPNRNDVTQIQKAGTRAATLTRQLLAFSRQQVVAVKVLDINAAISDLNTMLRRIIGEHIDLSFLPGRDLGHVKVAPGQIEQIIMNLCVNAKDAMPNGGKLLIETSNVELKINDVRSHSRTKSGPYVMAAISDTGVGMTANVLAHLYEPFFTTKEQGRGTGLGLSTVYGIVDQNNGRIEVYSELGYGTTFKIYFPRVDEPLFTAKESPVAPALHQGNETILLVEDDEMVRQFTTRVLNENGYTTLIASNPTEAIQIFQNHKSDIHLMLTDVVMPGMLGYELSQRLALIKPGLRVIYMSGYTEQSIIQRAMLKGALFIQKPMTAEVIIGEVRKALDSLVKTP